MPAPTTTSELVDLIRRSGVIEEARLNGYLQDLEASGHAPAEPTKYAGRLVRDGLLTYFQAEQLLQGKWKRFAIGKYRILERLGAGGMGQVFLCEHKVMRRRVAVKVLPTARAEDPGALDRFYREARAVAALDHPNLVRAFDIDHDGGLHFLVMEYVDGASFLDIVKKNGPMEPLRAAQYLYQAAAGLDYAHQVAGLVHRDIKPGNILLDRVGVVKVLDMGLARFFNDESDNLTQKHDDNLLGTADYLAPEQAIDSHSVDIRADIYSLGATFYYVLTGSPPFPEGSAAQKLIWHQSREPARIREIRREIPEQLDNIVALMLRKDRAERFQTPAELTEALAPWLETPIPPPPDSEMPQLSLAALGGAAGRSSARIPARPYSPAVGPPSKSGSSSVLSAGNLSRASGAGLSSSTRLTPQSTPQPQSNPFDKLIGGATRGSSTAQIAGVYRPNAGPLSDGQKRLAGKSAGAIKAAAVFSIIVGLAAAAYVWNRPAAIAVVESTAPKTAPSKPRARELVVNPTGGEESVRTLAEALRKVKSGDRIVLAAPTLEESLVLDGSVQFPPGVTIESGLPNGRPVVWSAAESASAGQPILEINGRGGFTFRRIVFDGRNVTETAVRVAGSCPGLSFDQVNFRGYTKAGLLLAAAQGEPGKPLSVAGSRFQPGPGAATAMRLEASADKAVRAVRVTDSQFDGAAASAVAGEGATTEVTFERNRFFKANDGIRWAKLASGQPLRLRLLANTFVEMRTAAVHLENSPADASSVVSIEQSLVAKSGAVLLVDGATEAAFANVINNLRDAQTADGLLPQPGRRVDVTFQSYNPHDTAKFLRYPRGSELSRAASNGGPIGAPPAD